MATPELAAAAAATTAALTPEQLLAVLVLGGIMGFLGQGARAVVGLKGMTDDARALDVSPNDLFQAARLLTSLMIGTLVGLAAAIIYIANGGSGAGDWHVLIGFAAAGYAGADFLEGFISTYLAPPGQSTLAGLAQARKTALSMVALKAAALPQIPASAQQLVLSVLNEALPSTKITTTTKLADIGFDDAVSKDFIRAAINSRHWHGVNLPFQALDDVTTIADIIKIVSAAQKS